jgi:deazaflavin-dependent oxidoreductase (nitroreductase family)
MSVLHRFIRWLGHRRWFAAAGRRFGAPVDRALYRATRGRLTSTAGAAVTSENFGQRRPAAWPLNLVADPRATVQVGADVVPCRARLLDDAEADVYWPRLVEVWPAHESCRARSGQRHTFVLEPV